MSQSSGASIAAPHPTIANLWVRETESQNGLILTGYCKGTMSDTTAATYLHGAQIVQIDAAGTTFPLWINTGSTASPAWTLLGSIPAGDIVFPLLGTVTETSATPGTVRVITGQNIAAATLTSGTLVGVRGEADIPNSGTVGTGTFMYGTQGKIVSGTGTTIDAGSGHIAGVYGQLDISGATTTSGHIAPVISSIQDTTNTARPAVNAFYGELPTYGSGAKANSVLQGNGGVTTDLDFTGVHADYFAELASDPSTAGGSVATQSGASAGSLVIKVGASTFKIPYFS